MSWAARAAVLVACALAAWVAYLPGREAALVWLAVGGLIAVLRREDWVTWLIAALPLASFAVTSGDLFVEEFDFLVIGCVAVRMVRCAPLARRDGLACVVIGAMLGLWLAAIGRGLLPWPAPLDLQHFDSPWNALRVGKSLLLAWLVAGALIDQGRGAVPWHAVLRGLAFAMAVVAAVCVWERAAFPGLTDFAADYRITGPFWEMHVGGAALDAVLAMGLPAVIWLGAVSGLASRAVALLIFAASTYVVFASFSRGLYLAVALELAVLAVLWWRVCTASGLTQSRVVFLLSVFAASGALLSWVFASGGYRAALAVGAVLFVCGWLGGRRAPAQASSRGQVVGLIVAQIAVTALVLAAAPRGVYLAFGLAALAALWGILRAASAAVCWAHAVWLAACALLVAGHWGGEDALPASTLAVLPALIIAGVSAERTPPLWSWSGGTAALWAGVLMMAGLAAALGHSYFLESRIATLDRDLKARSLHWAQAASIWSHAPRAERLFGLGLGVWPQLSRAHESARAGWPTHVFSAGDDGPSLSLRASAPGALDVLRVVQRVDDLAPRVHLLQLRARSPEGGRITVALCYRHLIYAQACAQTSVALTAGSDEWVRVTRSLDLGGANPGPWWAPRDAMLSLGVGTGAVEVGEVSVVDAQGRPLLVNGDFSRGAAHWFFTSDHHHLPWHVKQLGLSLLLETGALGVVCFASLLSLAGLRLLRATRRAEPAPLFVLAALIGALTVGAFDTVIDAPRAGWLFFLLTLLGASQPRPAARAAA